MFEGFYRIAETGTENISDENDRLIRKCRSDHLKGLIPWDQMRRTMNSKCSERNENDFTILEPFGRYLIVKPDFFRNGSIENQGSRFFGSGFRINLGIRFIVDSFSKPHSLISFQKRKAPAKQMLGYCLGFRGRVRARESGHRPHLR